MGIRDELVALTEYTAQRTLGRLDGLTDDEYRWQPAPGAWTVRKTPSGRVVLDNSAFVPGTPPFTALAWRIAHLVGVYGSPRNSKWLRVADPPTPPIGNEARVTSWTADRSVAMLRTAVDHFVGLLKSIDDDTWWELLGPGTEPYAEATLVAFAHHQIEEGIHHGAEVGVLRDLYRAQHTGPPPEPATVVDAAAAGRWDLVEAFVTEGREVNGGSPSALHHAVAVGDVEIVRLLVEHGADLKNRDEMFNGTPSFWARYYNRTDVLAYLRSAGSPGD